mmetsp:Transcript_114005/g.329326  ORF Transcript_114005/g.329326 Transcript_114005/m.329326 type:complete len:583 (-) Transcript_114005:77-1825(-)
MDPEPASCAMGMELRAHLVRLEHKLDLVLQQQVRPPSGEPTAVYRQVGLEGAARVDGPAKLCSQERLQCEAGDLPLRAAAAWSEALPGQLSEDDVQPATTSRRKVDDSMKQKDTVDNLWRGSFRLTTAYKQLGVRDWAHFFDSSKVERAAKRVGLSALWRRVLETIAATEKERSYEFVHSEIFECIVSGIILLQSIFIGYAAHEAFEVNVNGAAPNKWVAYMEIAFCVFFAIEVLIRVVCERLAFLFGACWKWNLFDSVLILLTLSDVATTGVQSGEISGPLLGRVLRLSRFVALMRLSRVMRLLPNLRIILLSILDSMVALLWSFLFIAFFMYIFAVLVLYGVSEHRRQGRAIDAAVEAELHLWWGGLYRSIVTLFMSISGGCDWADAVRPLGEMSTVYELLFLFYMFFMYFGVLNVVIGAFVATVQQIAASDPETAAKYAASQMEAYIHRIKGFFRQADVDHTGTLSWEEFRRQLMKPRVQAYFRALDLDVSQAHVMFDLLDVDGSGSVSVEEFVDGCVRLRGQARSIDLNRMIHMCEVAFRKLYSAVEAGPRPTSTSGAMCMSSRGSRPEFPNNTASAT